MLLMILYISFPEFLLLIKLTKLSSATLLVWLHKSVHFSELLRRVLTFPFPIPTSALSMLSSVLAFRHTGLPLGDVAERSGPERMCMPSRQAVPWSAVRSLCTCAALLPLPACFLSLLPLPLFLSLPLPKPLTGPLCLCPPTHTRPLCAPFLSALPPSLPQ